MAWKVFLGILGAALVSSPVVAEDNQPGLQAINTAYLHLPLRFEPLPHHSSKPGEFQVSGTGMTIMLSADRARLGDIRMRFAGAQRHATSTGLDLLSSHSNYFIGPASRDWRINVANYGQVKFNAVYPGIDLIYHGDARKGPGGGPLPR